jgi:hypothetical protein
MFSKQRASLSLLNLLRVAHGAKKSGKKNKKKTTTHKEGWVEEKDEEGKKGKKFKFLLGLA